MSRSDPNSPIDWSASERPPPKRTWRPGRKPVVVAAVVVALVLAAVVVFKTSFETVAWPQSMADAPTIRPGDHLLLEKGRDVSRGQFVVFLSPARIGLTVMMRVVAVAGDHISDRNGQIYLNGRLDRESYLPRGTLTPGLTDTVVPSGYIFVLGDNRDDSADSRAYGPIPLSSVKGHVVFRYWPISRLGAP